MAAEKRRRLEGGAPGFTQLLAWAPWSIGLAILAATASAVLSVLMLWLLHGVLVLAMASEPDVHAMRVAAGWMALALALRWVLMAGSHVLAHLGAFSIQHKLRLALARRLADVPAPYFDDQGSGRLRRTLTDDVNSLEGWYAHMLPDAVAAAVVPVAAWLLLWQVHGPLAVAAAMPLPLALAAQWWFLRGGEEGTREWADVQQRMADHVGEYVRGIPVVKAYGRDVGSFGELARTIGTAVAWVEKHVQQRVAGWTVFVGLLTANLVLVAPLGAWYHMQGQLSLADWLLFLLMAPAVLGPLLRLTFALGEQMQRAGALGRIGEVLRAPVLSEPRVPKQPASAPHVVCERVGVARGGRDVLTGVELRAPAGGLTALVGASGAGKSTLLRLVARLQDVDRGSVRVGGIDVRDWPRASLAAAMSIMTQEVFLLRGTVLDNLRVARPDATIVEIEAAARAAGAHDFITMLPRGYDTMLDEAGGGLSGGERQRLSMARALLKDAPLLLLDEPTAHLDTAQDTALRRTLASVCRHRTVLMATHRLDLALAADHIVFMERGRVVAQGDHPALLAGCAAYARMWGDYLHEGQMAMEDREPAP